MKIGIAHSFLSALCLLTGILSAADRVCPAGSSVVDFGAKGDGITDDTAAIRAAVAAAEKENAAMRVRIGHRCKGGGVGDGPLREVVFTKGTYKVSDTVLVARDMVLRGEDGATVMMTDSKKDVFYFHGAFRCRVSGLAIRGGAMQLRFCTMNNDTANVTVRGCRFENASETAVECLSYSYKTNGQTMALSPYLVNSGSPVRNPLYDGVRSGFPNSTLVTVEDSAFANCRRAVDVGCDGAVVRNCTIVSARHAEGGSLKFRNRVHVYGVDVTVKRDRCVRQCAIEAVRGGLLDVTDSVFRTDDGSGVCTVRSSMRPGYVPSYVNLENVVVESGADDESAPLVIERGTSPNMIRIAGVDEKGHRHVSPFHFIGGRDEETLKKIRYFDGIPVERTYVTEILEKASRHLALPNAPERHGARTILRAIDFGLDRDVRTDDTESVKRLFDMAAQKGNAEIVFPGTWIDLAETIDIPDGVQVTAEGTAGFRMKDEAKDIFRVRSFSDVRFENLLFEGGRHAVAMKAADRGYIQKMFGLSKAYASFSDCFFGDHASYAVVAIAGDGIKDCRDDFNLVMSGGVAYTAKIYRGNGTAWDDRRWTEIIPEARGKLTGSVAWENRGVLVMRDMLGVPLQVCGMIKVGETPIFEDAEIGDFRWVDNHGDFVSVYSRYGGEMGGVTPVYNYGSGRVLMTGGYAWFENRMAHQYPVLSDSPTAKIRLSCVGFSPNLRGNPIRFAWRDKDGTVRPMEDQKLTCFVPANAK